MILAPAMPAADAPAPFAPGPIVIWGYMGAGKSTVAERLAERLGFTMLDLDAYIVERVGMPVAACFAAQGETAFRVIEREALLAALDSGVQVLSVGGGALLDPELRARVRMLGTLVTLAVTPAVAARRLTASPAEAARRPLFDAGFAARFAERAAAYADADLIIDTDAATPDEVVTAVEGALRARRVL